MTGPKPGGQGLPRSTYFSLAGGACVSTGVDYTQKFTRPHAHSSIHDSLFSRRKRPSGAWGYEYDSGLREEGYNRYCPGQTKSLRAWVCLSKQW